MGGGKKERFAVQKRLKEIRRFARNGLPYRIGGVQMLPSGSHATVLLVTGKLQKVVKIIGGQNTRMSREVAENILEAMIRYHVLLGEIGVQLPKLESAKIEQNIETGAWFIYIHSPYCGENLGTYIQQAASIEDCLSIARELINILRMLFSQRENGSTHMPLGIDPKPANFASQKQGKNPFFIDLMPPRFREKEKIWIDYPEPTIVEDQELAYFRHFRIEGVLHVLFSQLCRLRCDFFSSFRMLIDAIAEEYGVKHFFENLPVTMFSKADEEERKRIIFALQSQNMYDVRDIALLLCYESSGLYGNDVLERLFQWTHFQGEVNAERMENAKGILLNMVNRLPVSL